MPRDADPAFGNEESSPVGPAVCEVLGGRDVLRRRRRRGSDQHALWPRGPPLALVRGESVALAFGDDGGPGQVLRAWAPDARRDHGGAHLGLRAFSLEGSGSSPLASKAFLCGGRRGLDPRAAGGSDRAPADSTWRLHHPCACGRAFLELQHVPCRGHGEAMGKR